MKEIKEKSSVFIKKQPTKERLHYTISYNIYIYTNRNEKTLINQQITPLKLDNNGNIEIGLCMVSLAPKNKEYQVEIKKHKSIDSWKYSWVQHKWLKGENFELTKNEKKVIQLAKQGYGTTKIADDLKRSINTIKNYRKNIFLKLNASNISEAVAIATHYKLI